MLVRYASGMKDRFEIEKGKHRFNSLFIILDGEYEYRVGKITKRILPYQPVIFKKGTAFEKRVIRPIAFVIVSPADFSYEGDWCLSYRDRDRVRLVGSVQHLQRAISAGDPDEVIEHFFRDILLTAARGTTEVADATVKAVCTYMEQNLNCNLPLSALAQVAGCSPQTLISKFKKQLGKTPVKYMTELRVRMGKELLVNSSLSVSEISEECGYENVYYFSNVFKKETGISPLKFRQGFRI